MIYLVVGLVALAVVLLVLGVSQFVTATTETQAVRKRLVTVTPGGLENRQARALRERQARRERLQAVLETVGSQVGKEQIKREGLQERLIQAGYRSAGAPAVFVGLRVLAAVVLGLLGLLVATASPDSSGTQPLLFGASGLLLGWMIPAYLLRRRARSRTEGLNRALPDALDLMVVCVEAGMGLNQALVKVGEEMGRISPALADEFILTSLEIRAGTPRDQALRNMGERTGEKDLRALMAMLIQTDRFGTSVADALKVHAEEVRDKRQQRAEEEAAKIGTKIVFPLVLFIFPAMFLVILGPSIFVIRDSGVLEIF